MTRIAGNSGGGYDPGSYGLDPWSRPSSFLEIPEKVKLEPEETGLPTGTVVPGADAKAVGNLLLAFGRADDITRTWRGRNRASFRGMSRYFVTVRIPEERQIFGEKARFVRDPGQGEGEYEGNVVVSEGMGFAMQMANDRLDAEAFNALLNGALLTVGEGLFAWRGSFIGSGGVQDLSDPSRVVEGAFTPRDTYEWGSATDADIDIVYEIIRAWEYADKGEGGYARYKEEYAKLIQKFLDQIWGKAVYENGNVAFISISSDTGLGGPDMGTLTSPSYISIAKLEAFHRMDGDPQHDWLLVAETQQKIREECMTINVDLNSPSKQQWALNLPGFLVVGNNAGGELSEREAKGIPDWQRYFEKVDPDNAQDARYRFKHATLEAALAQASRPDVIAKLTLLWVRTHGEGALLYLDPPDDVPDRYNARFNYDALRTYWRIAYDATASANPLTRERNVRLAQQIVGDLEALGPSFKWSDMRVYDVKEDSMMREPEMILAGLTALAHVATLEESTSYDFETIATGYSNLLSNKYREDGVGGYFSGGSASRSDYYENSLCYLSTYVVSGASDYRVEGVYEDDPLRGKQWQAFRRLFPENEWLLGGHGFIVSGFGYRIDPEARALQDLAQMMDALEGRNLAKPKTWRDRYETASMMMAHGMADEAVIQYGINHRETPFPVENNADEVHIERSVDGLIGAYAVAGYTQDEKVEHAESLVMANPSNPYTWLLYARVLQDSFGKNQLETSIALASLVLEDYSLNVAARVISTLDVPASVRRALGRGYIDFVRSGDTKVRLSLYTYAVLMDGYKKACEVGIVFRGAGGTSVMYDRLGQLADFLDICASGETPGAIDGVLSGAAAQKVEEAYREGHWPNMEPNLYSRLHSNAAFALLSIGDSIVGNPDDKLQYYKDALRAFDEAIRQEASIAYYRGDKGPDILAVLGLARCYRSLGSTYCALGKQALAQRCFGISAFLREYLRGNDAADIYATYLSNPETDSGAGQRFIDAELLEALGTLVRKAVGAEEERLRRRQFRDPRSLYVLRFDIDQAWRVTEMRRFSEMQLTETADPFRSSMLQTLQEMLYRGRVRPHFERISFFLAEGEVIRARKDCESLFRIAGNLEAYLDGEVTLSGFAQGRILAPEHYRALQTLYRDLHEILRDTPDSKIAADHVFQRVCIFRARYAAEFAQYSIYRRIGRYQLGYAPGNLHSDIGLALEESLTFETYRERFRKAAAAGSLEEEKERVRKHVDVMESAFALDALLEAHRVEDAEELLGEIIDEKCRYIYGNTELGEEPYNQEWFTEALNIYLAYAWGEAYGALFAGPDLLGNIRGARAIYMELLDEDYDPLRIDADTQSVLAVLRDKENAGVVRTMREYNAHFTWQMQMDYGMMLLSLYYNREEVLRSGPRMGIAPEKLEEIREQEDAMLQLMAEAYLAFEAAYNLDSQDQRAVRRLDEVDRLGTREWGMRFDETIEEIREEREMETQ